MASARGGQVLVTGLNPGTAMDIEAACLCGARRQGMTPRHDELDKPLA